MNTVDLEKVLADHAAWVCGEGGARADLRDANLYSADLAGANLAGADLACADLAGANLSRANLSGITLCRAAIDGADVGPGALSGPGRILCCLTPEEWANIQQSRAAITTTQGLPVKSEPAAPFHGGDR